MRFRPQLLLAPILCCAGLTLAAPRAVLAADGMTEDGTTTYQVLPDKAQIKVTIRLSIYNGKASQTDSTGVTYYWWHQATIAVEKEAGPVSATSDAGAVSQAQKSSDTYYRYVELTYPNVYYGQTRTVTASYTIPAAPHADGGFRAGKAYASLCAAGNGIDSGTVNIVLPTGFSFNNDSGGEMSDGAATATTQTYTSGPLTTPFQFWTCVDAEEEANLVHTPLTAGNQAFDIQAWPEDTAWSTEVGSDISSDVAALEALTGLSMPGGTVAILEAGDEQLGEYGGTYNAGTSTAQIRETIQKDTVAHELSHIWFNRTLFADKWVSEGLAGFSEEAAGTGNFTPCVEPGAYPGTGSPNLMVWQLLNNSSTSQQVKVSDYQYSAACYIFTDLAREMGPKNLALVLEAAAADDIAYPGASPNEQLAGAKPPLSSQEMLDLIDERGMVTAGTDLDTAQTLLAHYGIFDSATLAKRSTARADYHNLASAAKTWVMPLAIRAPMAKWQFTAAETAIDTAKQIIALRDSMQKLVPGLSLDSTVLQTEFQTAESQADLDEVLAATQKEADAAAKVDDATTRSNDSRSIFQSIGLLGTDVTTPLAQAKSDLAAVKPDSATSTAQTVIDAMAKAGDQGVLRTGAVTGLLALILLLLAVAMLWRSRRTSVVVLGPGNGPTGPLILLPPPDTTYAPPPPAPWQQLFAPAPPPWPPAAEWPQTQTWQPLVPPEDEPPQS